MATNASNNRPARRYQVFYAMLLRLYPRPFRERFAEGIAQTFNDLCRERTEANHGLFWFTLRTFFETSKEIVMENVAHSSPLGKTTLRVALGALAALMVPLIASRIVPGWNWNAGSFVFVYILFFAMGMAYALVARRMGTWSYKAAVALALLSAFALGWSTMVQVADSGHPENFAYESVLAVGLIGACFARLHARGLALTLFTMAATLVLITIFLPSGLPHDQARGMAIGHTALAILFTTAGLLFRRASLVESN